MSSPLYFDVPSYRSALASHLHAYDEWHQDSTVSPFSWPIFAKAQAALHPEMYQLAHITGHPLMLLCFSARFFFPLSLTVSFFICILHTGLQFVSSLLQTPHGQDSCCQDWHETPPIVKAAKFWPHGSCTTRMTSVLTGGLLAGVTWSIQKKERKTQSHRTAGNIPTAASEATTLKLRACVYGDRGTHYTEDSRWTALRAPTLGIFTASVMPQCVQLCE